MTLHIVQYTHMSFIPASWTSWTNCSPGSGRVCSVDNVKYTLFCKHGSAFRAGPHYLYIGRWILPDLSEYVVLCHGTMSRNEYNRISTQSELPIYEYGPVNWVDIFPYLDNGFFRFQRIGRLKRSLADPDKWAGGLKHGKWH